MNPALILAALLAWNPGGAKGSRGSTTDDTLTVWADAIAAVCTSRAECLLMASLASQETHFAPWVLDGDCNREAWRRMNLKDKVCDGGHSYGPWAIMDTTWATVTSFAPDALGIGPREHAEVAIHLLRTNPRGWMTYAAAKTKADAWMAAHKE